MFGSLISFIEIEILNNIAKNVEEVSGAKLLINSEIRMKLIFPSKAIGIDILISYIIIIISSLLPMKKVNKKSAIELIRQSKDKGLKPKQMKAPKLVSLLFKQEGELAYKNMRKDKSRYKTIVLSIMISIILFISIGQLLDIMSYAYKKNYKTDAEEYPQYQIYINGLNDETKKEEATNKVIKYLQDKKLISNYIMMNTMGVYSPDSFYIKIPKEKINKEALELANRLETPYEEIDGKIYIWTNNAFVFSGPKYDEILKEFGLNKPEKGECIINNIYFDEKYGKYVEIINGDLGEQITLKEGNSFKQVELSEEDKEAAKKEEEILKQIMGDLPFSTGNENENYKEPYKEYTLEVAGTAKIKNNFLIHGLSVIIGEETAQEMAKNDKRIAYYEGSKNIYLYSKDYKKLDEEVETINNLLKEYGEDSSILGINYNSDSSTFGNRKKIQDIVVYGFIIEISLLSMLNIWTTISSSISSRKREFAILKSMGMTNKQINKMLILEGLLYGLDALIYGILISTLVIYLMYTFMVDQARNTFYIPMKDFAICIGLVYLTIFTAILFAKRKLKKENIIDNIKDETI